MLSYCAIVQPVLSRTLAHKPDNSEVAQEAATLPSDVLPYEQLSASSEICDSELSTSYVDPAHLQRRCTLDLEVIAG